MKSVLIASLICLSFTTIYAQQSDGNIQPDSVKKKKSFSISVGKNENGIGLSTQDSAKSSSKAPGFSFALTFSRFDLGFSKLIDNGSFTLSPANDFLDYKPWKTHTVGFDLLQFGYRFNSTFRIYLAGGFDWTHIRLQKNITILRDQPVLSYSVDDIDYSKNRFSATYLRVPLAFEFRSHDNDRGKRFRFIAGPEAGFLLNGKVKQISSENGKQKFNNHYHFSEFRYGAFARLGYGSFGLFTKYYFNDMFENSPAQEGLNTMAFGLTFGF